MTVLWMESCCEGLLFSVWGCDKMVDAGRFHSGHRHFIGPCLSALGHLGLGLDGEDNYPLLLAGLNWLGRTIPLPSLPPPQSAMAELL